MYLGYTKGMETCEFNFFFEFNFFNSKSLRFYPIQIKYLGYLSRISYPMISIIFLGLSKKKRRRLINTGFCFLSFIFPQIPSFLLELHSLLTILSHEKVSYFYLDYPVLVTAHSLLFPQAVLLNSHCAL